ncbi:uncharacterized protein F5891DRAFT_1027095 [Suillus fuscotomentosus]|uniref:Uncharacterized protein n=1 Tax=Suillus fuscotomentosus TaxID=1912939 RepID=A0AAD4E9A2_9AGAM|nr:uncharacterized protein F5891DRAFT_1027095 [Suillus fuscotomentosus]KAG1902034.1 hypothetical protein F5891DRAFT_1027095 [Suillus fuscotomentosus]
MSYHGILGMPLYISLGFLKVLSLHPWCIAQKIFSVKPNDMPEERTMSVFTRMNSVLRNCQQVQTLVDITQIRQWHMYDPEKFRLREQPTLDFFDVEQVIFGKGKSTASRTHSITGSSLIIENGDEHEEILDEDTHTWLDDKIENMPGDSTFDAEEDIDLDVPELKNSR